MLLPGLRKGGFVHILGSILGASGLYSAKKCTVNFNCYEVAIKGVKIKEIWRKKEDRICYFLILLTFETMLFCWFLYFLSFIFLTLLKCYFKFLELHKKERQGPINGIEGKIKIKGDYLQIWFTWSHQLFYSKHLTNSIECTRAYFEKQWQFNQ